MAVLTVKPEVVHQAALCWVTLPLGLLSWAETPALTHQLAKEKRKRAAVLVTASRKPE